MSSLFQEQQQDLEREIVKLRRSETALESDRDRLADLLRAEKSSGTQKDKRIEELSVSVSQLEVRVQEARAVSGRLAEAEKKAGDAVKAEASMRVELASSVDELFKVTARLNDTTEKLAESEQERSRLKEEIGPFRRLIGALQARASAEHTIAAEIERLDA